MRTAKALMLTTMALAGIGVLDTPGALATEFHCDSICAIKVKPDGTGKTGHQVIIIKKGAESISTTCNTFESEGSSNTTTFTGITIKNHTYLGCSVAGLEAKIAPNGCNYRLTAAGEFSIVECPAGKSIEIVVPATGCVMAFGNQVPLGTVKYHNIGSTASKTTEITIEPIVQKISGTINGKCPIKEGTFTEGEFSTGNSLMTAQVAASGVMDSLWWA